MRCWRAASILTCLVGGCVGPIAPEVGAPIVGLCDPVDSDPSLDVSFQLDVLPLFLRPSREGGCGCHNPSAGSAIGTELTGLDLTRYDAVLRGGVNSTRDIVVSGDPCVSVLYLKVSDAPPFGGRMPLSGPPFFAPEELQLVHDWIAEGADDN